MLVDITPEFIPDNGRLGAPETGGDEDCVGFHPPFYEGDGPGDCEF
jgi:hypothetical protein